MRPEVVRAIESTSRRFVRLIDLSEAVGRKIASLLGVPAAVVTSGAAAALTLGTAAVLTGGEEEKTRRLPDLTGMKKQVIIQKTHRFPYDHMVRNCGIQMIEVETREQLEAAINAGTAMLLYLNKSDHLGQIKMDDFLAIARKARIPTMIDAAADVPPLENLTRPIRAGFDLIAVSGGKGIRGPQSAGLLLGRTGLIRAARLNTLPYSDTLGRSCKVNKEEMVGMMVAVEMFLKEDHAANDREWNRRVAVMRDLVTSVPGVTAEAFTPPIANQVPHLRVNWDPGKVRHTPAQVMQALRDGEPSIELVPEPQSANLEIASWMLQPGEAEIVGRRLKQILAAT
ncbi:MAG: PLP-dependent transferase [Acidobacteria bacterium]|nr:PLP-dependent transferase [Acidobacteriota bacterium]